MNRLAALIAGSWLGAQIFAGYVAAPVLFKSLEKAQAGEIAGRLFTVAGYLGLAAWCLVYLLARTGKAAPKPRRWIALQIMLIGLNLLVIQPVIDAVKRNTPYPLQNFFHSLFHSGHSSETGALTEFAFWHGFSSLVYMAVTVLGLLILSVYLRFEFKQYKHV